jgi:hypothetical protein
MVEESVSDDAGTLSSPPSPQGQYSATGFRMADLAKQACGADLLPATSGFI